MKNKNIENRTNTSIQIAISKHVNRLPSTKSPLLLMHKNAY